MGLKKFAKLMSKMYNNTIQVRKVFVHLNFHIQITEDTNHMTSHLMKSEIF